MITETSFAYQLWRGGICLIWAAYALPWINALYQMFPHIWRAADAVMGGWNGILFFAVVAVLDLIWGNERVPEQDKEAVSIE